VSAVSRFARSLDSLALLVFLVGAVCFGYAHLGMRRLQQSGFVENRVVAWAMIGEWNRWQRLSWIGLALVVIGVTVGVVSAIVHARQKRAASVARVSG
jgi:heme/copper-type cytochrome/quinol oxidase subunit 1